MLLSLMALGSAGVLLVSPKGRVLLCKRSDNRLWATPGGHIERGETPSNASLRELCEETQLCFSDEHLLESHYQTRRFYLFVLAIDSEPKPVLNHEHTAYKWCSLDALPKPLHPGLEWMRT